MACGRKGPMGEDTGSSRARSRPPAGPAEQRRGAHRSLILRMRRLGGFITSLSPALTDRRTRGSNWSLQRRANWSSWYASPLEYRRSRRDASLAPSRENLLASFCGTDGGPKRKKTGLSAGRASGDRMRRDHLGSGLVRHRRQPATSDCDATATGGSRARSRLTKSTTEKTNAETGPIRSTARCVGQTNDAGYLSARRQNQYCSKSWEGADPSQRPAPSHTISGRTELMEPLRPSGEGPNRRRGLICHFAA